MKTCSVSILITEKQNKMTLRCFTCHLTKLDNSAYWPFMYIGVGNASRYNCSEGEFGNIYHNYLCVFILTKDSTDKN